MVIEFHTQHAKVKDVVIAFARKELMKMAEADKQISRAEVILKEDTAFVPAQNKICEIRLTIFGGDLMASRRTNSFYNAVRGVIKELTALIRERRESSGEPPDVLISTVNV